MSKKTSNQVTVLKSDPEDASLEEILLTSIGRKRSGHIRMRYYSERGNFDEVNRVHNLSVMLSYKFKREMTSLDHQTEDRPTLGDLLYGDLPWVGLVKLSDDEADAKYRIEGFVRNTVLSDNMVFQLRDIRDGSPYAEGLLILDLKAGHIPGTIGVTTTGGLKQMQVVEMFQDYFESLSTLKDYLRGLGYVQCPKDKMRMVLSHNGEEVSTIEIALIGKVKEDESHT